MASNRALALLSLTLALCTFCATAETTINAVTDLQTLTTLANQGSATILNATTQQGTGTAIVQSNEIIIQSLAETTARMANTPGNTYSDADAQAILAALTIYVKAQIYMLNVEVGKRAYLNQGNPAPTVQYGLFNAPILVTLESMQRETDTYALSLGGQTPTQQPAIQGQFGQLQTAYEDAKAAYERLG